MSAKLPELQLLLASSITSWFDDDDDDEEEEEEEEDDDDDDSNGNEEDGDAVSKISADFSNIIYFETRPLSFDPDWWAEQIYEEFVPLGGPMR